MRKSTEERIDWIKANPLATQGEIAERFGITQQTAHRFVKYHGLEKARYAARDERDLKVARMAEAFGAKTAARKLGIAMHKVRYIVGKLK